VNTLASFAGDLVAGGIFTQAGGVAANRLARWNGSSWSAFPGITGQEVTKLAVFGGELYASGNPLLSPASQYLARWDGAHWQPLGGGITSPAAVLIPDEAAGKLYVGGFFHGAGGQPGWNFARWDTSGGSATAFCPGDGSSTACPCSNSGATGHGCQNSAGTGGALLTASGSASLAADTLHFTSSGELPTALSILLQGESAIAPVHFGDGLRCAGGTLKRLYVDNASGGMMTAPQSGDPSVSARSSTLGDPIPLGATRNYQVYYRDPSSSFCPDPLGSTFNVTSAIAIAWGS
jgi:hypothetical protein